MDIRAISRSYAHADDRRAWMELGATVALYILALVIALASIGTIWVMVPAIVLTALMGLRVYMIQHDCLHGSFFNARRTNDLVGMFLSPISMTPYRATQRIHLAHHAHVSDLDHRETFEIYVMTLKEWEVSSWVRRLGYRIYRHPVTLLLVGPFILFAVIRRAPAAGWKTGIGDLLLHNGLLAIYLGLIWGFAGWAGIAVWAVALLIACFVGALISYVVHNFETIHWGVKPELDFTTAALEGSAVLDWGTLFDLATMNIAYHDLHHLNANIPGYKLKAAHRELEDNQLIQSTRIGFLAGLGCLRWKLYDEERGRMITFGAAARIRHQTAPA